MLTHSVVNIDWLQLNCRPTNDFYSYELTDPDYKIVKTDISTRTWKAIDEVFYCNRKIATIVHEPTQAFLDAKTFIIKFDNYFLYRTGLQDSVNQCLHAIGLTAYNITRLDIAMDFQNFANSLKPQKLIERFLISDYLKIGKGKGQLIFNHNYNVTKEYIKFGSSYSNICYYLYNKTKELNEVKKKPYIEDCWQYNGFDMSKPTWRLEFSIKTGNAELFNKGTGEFDVLKDCELLTPSFYNDLFFTLTKKYFTFYYNNGSGKKCRMDKIDLFGELNITRELQWITRKLESNRSDKIHLNKMAKVWDELRDIAKDNELLAKHTELMNHFVTTRNLQNFAKHKGIDDKLIINTKQNED